MFGSHQHARIKRTEASAGGPDPLMTKPQRA
jgi:hypothetical protein